MVCQSLCVKDATEHLWGEALCAMPSNLMSEPIVVEWHIQGQGVMVSNPQTFAHVVWDIKTEFVVVFAILKLYSSHDNHISALLKSYTFQKSP